LGPGHRPLLNDIIGQQGSLRAAARELNDRGVKTRSGGKWHPTIITNILKREI
jgi:hypothetical protein